MNGGDIELCLVHAEIDEPITARSQLTDRMHTKLLYVCASTRMSGEQISILQRLIDDQYGEPWRIPSDGFGDAIDITDCITCPIHLDHFRKRFRASTVVHTSPLADCSMPRSI